MNHGAVSFCKTNASRRPEFIKSESEPEFHAETHYRDVDVGSIVTRLSQAEATKLRKMLDKLRRKQRQPPATYAGEADIVWVHPTLIVELMFRAWASDGKLRHAAYKGFVRQTG